MFLRPFHVRSNAAAKGTERYAMTTSLQSATCVGVASISRLSPSKRTKVTLQFVRLEGESLEIEAM